MNKAVTEGLVLTPPPFQDGLAAWSSADGRPGQPTYEGSATVQIVAGDTDFGDCLEILKTQSVQRLRYTGRTPVAAGCYLRVTARVKIVGGNRASVRIAAWAGQGEDVAVTDVPTTGEEVYLEQFARVYEVSAIIGSGARGGVDMPWGLTPSYAHVGLDIIGDQGGFIRIDDLVVEDVTGAFLRDMMDWVDVRDYGATGDGITDDSAAFVAADAAALASGRSLLVSAGDYVIDDNVTLDVPVRFEGRIVAASTGRIAFTRAFSYATYLDAFEDEQVALERALEALYNFTDHESLDLGGRRIQLTRPIDVAGVTRNRTTFGNRRVIRNGQLEAVDGPAWASTTVQADADYDAANPLVLTNVSGAATIERGSLVDGLGVGREVYVREIDVPAARITLSQPLWGAQPRQGYSFTRHRYMLDFSGFASISRQVFSEVEFLCGRAASALMLGREGIAWHIHDCWFVRPKDRGITSIGEGCNGITIETNEFISAEELDLVQDRASVAFNTNSNDMKVRNNRSVQFRHFGVMAGGGHIITGNHWWQGDSAPVNGERSAGLILTQPNAKTTITGNYCDNAWIEISNEHDATPGQGLPFGAISIVGNIFTASDIPAWFTYLRLAPFGQNTRIDGLSVVGNAFKTIGNDLIFRVDEVDDARGTVDHGATRDVTFSGNSYESVAVRTESPARVSHEQASEAAVWTVGAVLKMPFGGRVLSSAGLIAEGAIRRSGGAVETAMPWTTPSAGASGEELTLHWPAPVAGRVTISLRCDLAQ